MKKPLLLLLTLSFATLVFSSYHNGIASKGLGNRTGTTGSPSGCAGSGCHTVNLGVNSSLWLCDQVTKAYFPGGNYVPGRTYEILFSADPNPLINGSYGLGFQVSAINSRYSIAPKQAGTFLISGINSTKYHITSVGGFSFAEHDTTTTPPSYSVLWTAPQAGFGNVEISVRILCVNKDGTPSGDYDISNGTLLTESHPTSVASLPEISGFSTFPNPVIDVLHLHIEQPTAIEYKLCVFDIYGYTQLCQKLSGSELQNTARIPVSNLPAGFYGARVTNGSSQKTFFFAKQ